MLGLGVKVQQQQQQQQGVKLLLRGHQVRVQAPWMLT
jgi:hypothetical protein